MGASLLALAKYIYYSLFAYPFVNRLAHHLYHIRPATYQKHSVHIRRTLLRAAEIWIFLFHKSSFIITSG